MQRRQLLALAGASWLPVAGCLGADGAAPADPPSESSRSGSETNASDDTPPASTLQPSERRLQLGESVDPATGPTVTVTAVTVSELVRSTSIGSPTHVDVACADGRQFVVLEADATGADGTSVLGDVEFALDLDGTRYPGPDEQRYWALPPGTDRPGRPAIAVPVADVTDGTVVWRREPSPVRWDLPAEIVDALGRSPAFAVRSFDTPDAVARGERIDVAVTVANTGDREGRFVAELGAGPLSDHGEFTMPVPAGGERTHTELLEPFGSEDAATVEVTLAWGCGRRRRSVAIGE